ncbi:putative RING-containing E3 ubiquitin ligase [Trachipleistophora hominis]|uniref:Putative RING-containing E3 ubiquitin ligase n=1 Tax=Trachipleistophora hominis TaxID=72359 RepID=L7JXU3_TRAHO|nr:putative RING-containing E3 ubiquitin ligase [Trachipleistophora hominis]
MIPCHHKMSKTSGETLANKNNNDDNMLKKQEESDEDSHVAHKNDSDDGDTIVLSSRPINMTRRTMLSIGPGGIPIIRDIIIIETEASLSRLLYVLGLLFVYCVIMQSVLLLWERYYPRSCKLTVGAILWFFPFFYAIFNKKYVFIAVWVFYNLMLCILFKNVFFRPIDRNAPRRIYSFFNRFFQVCHFNVISCIVGMAASIIMQRSWLMNIFLVVFIYILYFAVLSQEIITFNSELMAFNVGYYSKDAVPAKVLTDPTCCALCDHKIDSQSITLNCTHKYHASCIKGWFLISKKEFCPLCKEKMGVEKLVDGFVKGEMYFAVFMDILRRGIVFCLMFVLVVLYGKL